MYEQNKVSMYCNNANKRHGFYSKIILRPMRLIMKRAPIIILFENQNFEIDTNRISCFWKMNTHNYLGTGLMCGSKDDFGDLLKFSLIIYLGSK